MNKIILDGTEGRAVYEELVKQLRELEDDFMCIEDGYKVASVLSDTTDAIEELSKPRWTPVTERSIHNGMYLVVCKKWGGSAVRKAIYDEATGKWFELCSNSRNDITDIVTHWMAIPDLPEDDIQKDGWHNNGI